MKKLYSLGFMFDINMKKVVLIIKNKPGWQSGLLNGVGGAYDNKIDLSLLDCMVREFQEETGLITDKCEWKRYARMIFDDCVVFCFKITSKDIYKIKTTTGERVGIYEIRSIPWEMSLYNLKILIELALYEKPKNEKIVVG